MRTQCSTSGSRIVCTSACPMRTALLVVGRRESAAACADWSTGCVPPHPQQRRRPACCRSSLPARDGSPRPPSARAPHGRRPAEMACARPSKSLYAMMRPLRRAAPESLRPQPRSVAMSLRTERVSRQALTPAHATISTHSASQTSTQRGRNQTRSHGDERPAPATSE